VLAVALLGVLFLGALDVWKRAPHAPLHLLPVFLMTVAEMVSGQPYREWLFSL